MLNSVFKSNVRYGWDSAVYLTVFCSHFPVFWSFDFVCYFFSSTRYVLYWTLWPVSGWCCGQESSRNPECRKSRCVWMTDRLLSKYRRTANTRCAHSTPCCWLRLHLISFPKCHFPNHWPSTLEVLLFFQMCVYSDGPCIIIHVI